MDGLLFEPEVKKFGSLAEEEELLSNISCSQEERDCFPEFSLFWTFFGVKTLVLLRAT